MDIGEFTERVRAHAEQSANRLLGVKNEAQTRSRLVEPFLRVMGYHTDNDDEVDPEYGADVGAKKGKRVDYALLQDGKPIILIECKPYRANLGRDQAFQLLGYFNQVISARIGILTDGVDYRFFADLEHPNTMDVTPFFELNILKVNDEQVRELFRFTKDEFSTDKVVALARDLKAKNAVKDFLARTLNGPSAEFSEFVSFVVKGLHVKPGGRKAREQYAPLVKEALQQYIRGRARSSAQSGTARAREAEPSSSVPGGDWRSLDEVISDYRPGSPAPSALRLPGAPPEEVSISRWSHVLTETAKWLAAKHGLASQLPIGRGGKRSIANSEPRHQGGAPFNKAHEVARGVFVETNLRGENSLRSAAFLLERFDEQRPVYLRWDG